MTRNEARREIERMRQVIAPHTQPPADEMSVVERAKAILSILARHPENEAAYKVAREGLASLDTTPEPEKTALAVRFINHMRQIRGMNPDAPIICVPTDRRNPSELGLSGNVLLYDADAKRDTEREEQE